MLTDAARSQGATSKKLSIAYLIVPAFMMFSGLPVKGQHQGDLWVGQAEGRVALSRVSFDPDRAFHELLPADGPVVFGWSDNEPGFEAVEAGADPLVGTLLDGVQIWLVVVSVEPALRVIDNGFNVLDMPGQMTLLGGHHLHIHVTWNIDDLAPGFDPEKCLWFGTFVLRDLGGTFLQDSLPFTIGFSTVPLKDADGDFDWDRDADHDDTLAFPVCISGPGVFPEPNDSEVTTCVVDCFNAFDFEPDRDIDLRDFAKYQNEFTGSQ